MRFRDEREIYELVAEFEAATLDRNAWRHAEHLAVALVYIVKYGEADALEKMRSGLFILLEKGFGVDLTIEMPYHETLTVFWIKAVDRFNAARMSASLLERANQLIETHDKDLPLKYYTREALFSDEARRVFVQGDIQTL